MFTYTAFEEFRVLSRGSLEQVAIEVRKRQKSAESTSILIFSDTSGKQMDLDLSGTERETLERLKIFSTHEATPHSGPGRPKLGVVAREISLLPAHWEWLSNQGGGASAVLRRMLEEKMKTHPAGRDQVKQSQETTYQFLTAMAGNLPHFEEVIRFLYRRDRKKFREWMVDWPKDVVSHALNLAEGVFFKETK